jgi:hypothetical protein
VSTSDVCQRCGRPCAAYGTETRPLHLLCRAHWEVASDADRAECGQIEQIVHEALLRQLDRLTQEMQEAGKELTHLREQHERLSETLHRAESAASTLLAESEAIRKIVGPHLPVPSTDPAGDLPVLVALALRCSLEGASEGRSALTAEQERAVDERIRHAMSAVAKRVRERPLIGSLADALEMP